MSKRLWTAAEASEKSGAQGVRERVAAAIREGVPLYNGGDAAGCARVYGLAAQELLGAVGPGGQATLRRALEADGGADARAWALRRALDSVADGGGPGLLRDFVAADGHLCGERHGDGRPLGLLGDAGRLPGQRHEAWGRRLRLCEVSAPGAPDVLRRGLDFEALLDLGGAFPMLSGPILVVTRWL